MDYEILVINEEIAGRSAVRGEIATARPKGHVWKTREMESRFARISYICTTDELAELLNGEYKYDFSTQKFVHAQTNEDFDKNLILEDADAVVREKLSRTVAAEIDPDWEDNESEVCKFLFPIHLDFPENKDFRRARRYWFNKFRKFKSLTGVREFLATILFRDFGGIAECWKNLDPQVKATMSADPIFTEEDKEWNIWLRGV